MKIILVSGQAGAGKDTFFELAETIVSARRIAFADELKEIAEENFNWDKEKDKAGRQLLIDIGRTARNYNENFWVNKVINKIKTILYYPYLIALTDYIIVTDWRYQNEYERMKDAFGKDNVISLRIERESFQSTLTPEQKKDQSEVDLENFPFDFVIENGTLDDFLANIKIFFDFTGGEKRLTSKFAKSMTTA